MIYRLTICRISLFVMSVFYLVAVKKNLLSGKCGPNALPSPSLIASVTTKQCDSIPLTSSVCCSINHSSLVQHMNVATAKTSRSFEKQCFKAFAPATKGLQASEGDGVK